MVSKQERDDSIRTYLGEDNLKKLQGITADELELFQKQNIDISASYVVKGSRSILEKFKVFFVTLCAYERLSYSTLMIKDFAEGITESNEELLFTADRELLFLYVHKEASGLGNTEAWMCSTVVDKAANRNRKGLRTVVLTERDIPLLSGSTEFINIDLGGAVKSKRAEDVARDISSNSEKASTYVQY